MVLYHCVSSYHIIQAMVHKKVNHADQYSVLIIADFTANKFEKYQELSYFFDEIVLFPYRSIEHKRESIIEEMREMYEERVPYSIDQFEEIYVAAAHYYFSLYLISQKQYFHFMEDGCGILSKPKVSYEIVLGYAPIQANIAQTYGMFDGTNKYVIDRICNLSAQSFQMYDDNIVDFDLVKEIKKCSSDYINSIMRFFRVERSHQDLSEYTIIFTQQLANLGVLTFEEQILIYQLAIDFFVSTDRIAFKIHPDDVMYYKYLFPDSYILEGRYPSELLPFISDKMANNSMTIFSSSILSIKSAFGNNIFCGYDFYRTYKKIDSYYFALKILNYLEISDYQLFGYGVDVKLVDNLIKHSLENINKMKVMYPQKLEIDSHINAVYLFDDIDFESDIFKSINADTEFEYEEIKVYKGSALIENEIVHKKHNEIVEKKRRRKIERESVINLLGEVSKNDIVCFLNTRKDYCFYEYKYRDFFEQMIPIRIDKQKLRDKEVYHDVNVLTLYFYTKNEKIKEKIKKYEGAKVMKNTGLSESVSLMTDEQRRIAILEGMLEATEKRLAYYIEKEKKQREKDF